MLYLARNKNGMLGCYSAKPKKIGTVWNAGIIGFVGFVLNDDFKNIKWEDEEPTELDLKIVATEQIGNCGIKEIEREINHHIPYPIK